MAQSNLVKAWNRWGGVGPGRPSEHELVQYVGTDEEGAGIREKVWSVEAMVHNAPSAVKKMFE